jgi:hypothetical protein
MERFTHRPFTLACLVVMLSVSDTHPEGRAAEPLPTTSHADAERQGSKVGTAPGVPRLGPNGWGTDDERGNGNTQGVATRMRCAALLAHPRARVYELGRAISGSMPQNPFGDAPVDLAYLPTRGIPFTRHAGNGEVFSGGIGSQGTPFDALGHFGVLETAWSGAEPFRADQVTYYTGARQSVHRCGPDPTGRPAGPSLRRPPQQPDAARHSPDSEPRPRRAGARWREPLLRDRPAAAHPGRSRLDGPPHRRRIAALTPADPLISHRSFAGR